MGATGSKASISRCPAPHDSAPSEFTARTKSDQSKAPPLHRRPLSRCTHLQLTYWVVYTEKI